MLAVAALFVVTVLQYFAFTADDAYITYRYAENLIDLVFNEGERVAAFTSPAHTLVSAVLHRVTGHTAVAWKIVAVLLVVASTLVLLSRLRGGTGSELLVLVLVPISPAVLLWTVGGLETPLLLFWVTVLVVLACSRANGGVGRLSLLCVVAGLCFVTRYDSVLFTVPVVLHAFLRVRRLTTIIVAGATGAVIPAAWLLFARIYYGEIFPTSYFTKDPFNAWRDAPFNLYYVCQNLIYLGVVPVTLLLLGLLWWTEGERVRRRRLATGAAVVLAASVLIGIVSAFTLPGLDPILPGLTPLVLVTNTLSISALAALAVLLVVEGRRPGRLMGAGHGLSGYAHRTAGVYAGLLFVLGYALLTALVHMMFSFRLFIPYLPAAAYLMAELLRVNFETGERRPAGPSRRRPVALAVVIFCGALVLFQAWHAHRVYRVSINGFSTIGEYTRLGLHDYVRVFMPVMQQSGREMEEHWGRTMARESRRPRLLTYAAGAQPYAFRDAHVFEWIVSYRHDCPADMLKRLPAFADYVAVIVPRHGPIQEQLRALPGPLSRYPVVSDHRIFFDGAEQAFVVVHNVDIDLSDPLPGRIDGRCPP